MTATKLAKGRLENRIALVTGASRGIGRSIALGFAREGAHVIALARTQGALEALDDEIKAAGGSCTLVPADLKDFDGLDNLGATIHERWGKLDIFVGNAGVLGDLTPMHHLEPKVFDELIAVNVTANYRLIRSLDMLLRASDAGRVILVSSGAGEHFHAFWGGYSITKAALNAMAKVYAEEVANSSIRVNIVNPGATRTKMRAIAAPGEDPDTLPHPDELVDMFVELASPECTRNGEIVAFKR
jgi:NAD(P)-dependent dehydrogenase (short-subunit alcohol dehydrogenase family)